MIAAVEYLDKRSDIKDIAMIGLSGGGVVAAYVAGLSKKIKCIVLSNSFGYIKELDSNYHNENQNTKKKFKYPMNPLEQLKFYQNLKIKNKYSENIDNMYLTPLALLPRIPLLIQFGQYDQISQKIRKELIMYCKKIYSRFNSEHLLDISIEKNRGHEFVSTPIIEFLQKNMK